MVTTVPRAASVVLLRETTGGDAPFEVYMLRRPARARFAPGAYTFPGGVLEGQDRDGAVLLRRALDSAAVAALHARLAGAGPFGVPDAATSLALLACAARELFEETGVLLMRGMDGTPLRPRYRPYLRGRREGLLAGRQTFAEWLREEPAVVSPGDFTPFSHWITPEASPLRFDTHFFLATLPPGQEATHWPGELDDGRWIAPAEALARQARGDFPLLPVQTAHLARFAAFDSLAALLAVARRKAVPAVLPTLTARGEAILPEEVAECW